jgi:hypothetical protein
MLTLKLRKAFIHTVLEGPFGIYTVLEGLLGPYV